MGIGSIVGYSGSCVIGFRNSYGNSTLLLTSRQCSGNGDAVSDAVSDAVKDFKEFYPAMLRQFHLVLMEGFHSGFIEGLGLFKILDLGSTDLIITNFCIHKYRKNGNKNYSS